MTEKIRDGLTGQEPAGTWVDDSLLTWVETTSRGPTYHATRTSAGSGTVAGREATRLGRETVPLSTTSQAGLGVQEDLGTLSELSGASEVPVTGTKPTQRTSRWNDGRLLVVENDTGPGGLSESVTEPDDLPLGEQDPPAEVMTFPRATGAVSEDEARRPVARFAATHGEAISVIEAGLERRWEVSSAETRLIPTPPAGDPSCAVGRPEHGATVTPGRAPFTSERAPALPTGARSGTVEPSERG